MFIYTYVVARDFGFAPNPFYGICTLATCKPGIRKSANIGDWIFGIGSKTTHINRLIYMMKVTKKITYNEYWYNEEYFMKKPQMTTLKKMYGDNIYHQEAGIWYQADSHHSYENGEPNPYNVKKDTSSDNVLISNDFFYFGKKALKIPNQFTKYIYRSVRGYCKDEESSVIQKFIAFVQNHYEPGYHSDPILFIQFERYDGVS